MWCESGCSISPSLFTFSVLSSLSVGAIEKQKLVYILNRDAAARLTISSPLEAHKANTLVYHVVGVDVGFENPMFACLEMDYEVMRTHWLPALFLSPPSSFFPSPPHDGFFDSPQCFPDYFFIVLSFANKSFLFSKCLIGSLWNVSQLNFNYIIAPYSDSNNLPIKMVFWGEELSEKGGGTVCGTFFSGR